MLNCLDSVFGVDFMGSWIAKSSGYRRTNPRGLYMVKMMLMTQEILKRIPAIGSTESIPLDEKIVHVKFFHPCSSWSWYAFEYDPATRLFFGMVNGHELEMGSFSLDELDDCFIRGCWMERDAHVDVMTWADMKKHEKLIGAMA